MSGPRPAASNRTAPQLITYADRLAGDLPGVTGLLDGPLRGAFAGVHVLPFFTPIDGADAGFDPIDHLEVDPRVGTWDDIAHLAAGHEVMADIIVNHVSDESPPFRDWSEKGEASPYHGMFLTFDSVFPDGANEEQLTTIYRPRPGLPFTRVRTGDGRVRLLWTTFTAHQVDVDVEHPVGWAYLLSIIDRLATAGVRVVRLDAVGYAIKRPGTSCFMLPETLEFVDRVATACRERDITVLVEVHGHHQMQIEIARRVDLVYDFALPPLVLDALANADSGPLRRWLAMRPTNAVNVLDTHDGIGVIDIGADPTHPERAGLLDPERLSALVEIIHRASGDTSRAATGAAASNLDLYQVNCTYYDAIGRDDERYLLARLLQCLVPGTPQVYYVGLLAEGNDMALLAATGVGRDINRHVFTDHEVAAALDRPVVQHLLALLRWRAACPVFDGQFTVIDADPGEPHLLGLRWHHDDAGDTPSAPASTAAAPTPRWTVDVRIDLAAATWSLVEQGPGGTRTVSSFSEL